MISVIVPTYREPQYLDLCIESALKGQTQNNEIIVVIDGYENSNNEKINKSVLEKYKNKIVPIILERNYGQQTCTNQGVYAASNDHILIVNDDNVFPLNWDTILLNNFQERMVVAPNQIEPKPSMFKSFIIQNYGGSTEDFSLDKFQSEEPLYRTDHTQNDGCTLPIFMKKIDYISIGGWDESYPSGHVVDWDFFLKCELNGFKMLRNMKLNFYHFGGISTRNPRSYEITAQKEKDGFEYFKHKWGKYPCHNPVTNSKLFQQ